MVDRAEEVTLPCAIYPKTDALTLYRSRSGETLVFGTRCGTDTEQNIYLDAAGARALFNWLGVELHKGGLRS